MLKTGTRRQPVLYELPHALVPSDLMHRHLEASCLVA
jgi:hypothetical protein